VTTGVMAALKTANITF